MNNIKAWFAMTVHISLLIFIFVAIWPALKVGSEGYNTKKKGFVAPESRPETVVEAEPISKPGPIIVEEPQLESSSDALYSVVDGNKLDANSYAGFKLYRNWCARCHGTYGQGMVGPNLADSLNVINKEAFFSTVENGKAGSIGSMPAWKANIKVMEGRDQLYAYLMARADGAIGIIKPKKQE